MSLVQIRHPTFSICMDTLNNGVPFLFATFATFSRQKEMRGLDKTPRYNSSFSTFSRQKETGPEIHARNKNSFDIIFRQKKREPTPTDSQKEKTHKGPFAIFSRPLIESEIKSEKKSEIEKRKSEIKLAII